MALSLRQDFGPSQLLISYQLPGTLTTDLFVATLDEYVRMLCGSTVVDNASTAPPACRVRVR